VKKEKIIIAVLVLFVLGGLLLYAILNTQNKNKQPQNNLSVQNTKSNEVIIENLSFSPESIIIKPGTYVTFINKDAAMHTIIESSQAFNKEIKPGDTLRVTFDKVGTYNYTCSIQPAIQGIIIVQPPTY